MPAATGSAPVEWRVSDSLVPYEAAVAAMEARVADIAAGRAPELVWLLGAVAKGDKAAFERLYGATRAKLYGVLLRILGRPELAEEVMQETYLRVWSSAGQFDPGASSPVTSTSSGAATRC